MSRALLHASILLCSGGGGTLLLAGAMFIFPNVSVSPRLQMHPSPCSKEVLTFPLYE